MKWFKHFSDAYTNMKLRQVVATYGMEGYGFYWLLCELVAQQGADSNFRIKAQKNWKKVVQFETKFSEEKCDEICIFLASVDLISAKALEIDDLSMPKMRDYSDEYTKKLRSKSRHSPENVVLEENRTEEDKKKRKKIAYTEDFESFFKTYPKKVGKKNAFEQWKKLSPEERKAVMVDIPKRKADDKWMNGFVKDPERYLKHRQWEDEIKPPRRGMLTSSKPVGDKYDALA